MNISKRAYNLAKQQAQALAARAYNLWSFRQAESWEQLEKLLGITVPDLFKQEALDYKGIKAFQTWWVSGLDSRLNVQAQEVTTQKLAAVSSVSNYDQYGEITLLPEQQIVVDAIWKDMFIENLTHAALQDGTTGSGKTFVAGALIARCIAKGLDKDCFAPIGAYLVLTRKTVVEKYKRELERMGLGQYVGNKIIVSSYSALPHSYGKMFFIEHIDPFTGDSKLEWNPALVPVLTVFDESHALNNWETFQTRAAMALLKANPAPRTLYFSATPFITVNNTRTFVIACRTRFMGMEVTEANFNVFAMNICREPQKPNQAAAKRLRELLGKFIYSFPYVKWPHKAINDVILCRFRTERARQTYNNAYLEYVEACRKVGKKTDFGGFERLVAMGQFRKKVEPLRVEDIIDKAFEDHKNGYAILLGCSFRHTVHSLVFQLAQRGVTRDQISIIYGGKKEIKQSMLLTEAEIDDLLMRSLAGDNPPSKYEMRRLQETIDWRTDRQMNQDADEESQIERHALLKNYRLTGSQTSFARQNEIDNFQEGRSTWCIFTLAAGGVGLSLDHWKVGLRPRRGYFTPVYSGYEFIQSLGRGLRRTTLSDIHQSICCMEDTIEEFHVVPILDSKLKCVSSLTAKAVIVDLAEGIMKEKVKPRLRTEEEVLKDSENPESQLHEGESPGGSDEDDNDE